MHWHSMHSDILYLVSGNTEACWKPWSQLQLMNLIGHTSIPVQCGRMEEKEKVPEEGRMCLLNALLSLYLHWPLLLSLIQVRMHELPWYESMLTCSQHSRGPAQLVQWICMWQIFVHCTPSIGIPAETRCSWLHGLTCLIMAVLLPSSDNTYTASHTSVLWVVSRLKFVRSGQSTRPKAWLQDRNSFLIWHSCRKEEGEEDERWEATGLGSTKALVEYSSETSEKFRLLLAVSKGLGTRLGGYCLLS